MSYFINSLKVEMLTCPNNIPLKNRSGRQLWKLTDSFSYQSDIAGMIITAPTGMITDFASVPRIPVVYLMLGEIANEPGTIHDAIYSLCILPRDVADSVLKEMCLLTGISAWKAQAIYLGVRVGGASHYQCPNKNLS